MTEKMTFIDFETTGFTKNRAVSLGIVHYENDIRKVEKYYLINPKERIEGFAYNVHGISLDDVKEEPTFLSLWKDISQYIEGCTLVAHNAKYDVRVLKGEFERYNINCSGFDVICTCESAKKLRLEIQNNKLDTLCNFFNIELENHHNALDDTIACEKVYFALKEIKGNLIARNECIK